MSTTSRRPRPSAEQLERAIAMNTKALAEHRRAAGGRTLTEAQVAEVAQTLLEKMAAPTVPVRETATEAKVRRLTEAAAEPSKPLHLLTPEELNADAARRWAAILGPAAG